MLKDINLLPDNILLKNRRRMRAALTAACVLLVCSGLLAAASVPTFQRQRLEGEIRLLDQKIDSLAMDELTKAQREVGLKQQELDSIQASVKSIDSGRLSAVKLITQLAQQMPFGINAKEVKIEAANRMAVVEMTADKREDIVLLLKRLNDDPQYSSVNISPINGIEKPFDFTITLEISQKD